MCVCQQTRREDDAACCCCCIVSELSFGKRQLCIWDTRFLNFYMIQLLFFFGNSRTKRYSTIERIHTPSSDAQNARGRERETLLFSILIHY